MKENNLPPLMLQMLLLESTCDSISKMLMGYVLNMPMNEKFYDEKGEATLDFLEQALPTHAGAFAIYFRVLEKFAKHKTRNIPEGMRQFINENLNEIEKFYGERLPDKYRPSGIITQSKTLVDAQGFEIGQTFEGSIQEASMNPPKLSLV